MNSYEAHFIKAVTAIVSMLILNSCAASYTMESSNISALPSASPMKIIPSKTFAFKEFTDTRGYDPYVVGQWGSHRLILEKPAADTVADAVKKEFERNGHSCVSVSQQAESDFLVTGTVYKYYLSWFGLASVKAIADVGITLTMRSQSSHNSIVKNYQGEYPITGDSEITSEMQGNALNQALLNVLRQIFYDDDLIQFIRKNSEP